MNTSTILNIIFVFFGILFITLLVLSAILSLYRILRKEIEKLIRLHDDKSYEIIISKSPLTNSEQIILTIHNGDSELKNCHVKITDIKVKKFNNNHKEEIVPLPITNQKLEWHSVDSKDGFVSVRPKTNEDLNLAWARDTRDVWSQYDKFGFAYIPKKPQTLEEGIYYITVRVEGDIQVRSKTKTVRAEKSFRLGFYMEQYLASLDGYSTRPVVRLYEGSEIKTSSGQFKQPFEIRMTKTMLIRELENFVYKTQPRNNLIPVITLLKRRTNGQFDIVQNTEDVDAIKLHNSQYRGLLIEITEKEAGLWVVVKPEGESEPVDILQKDGSWMNTGTKLISVDEQAHIKLLKWLESI